MSVVSDYVERQEDELEFLQAVFPNPGEFQDLRLKDTWKIHRPPEFILVLVPQKSLGGSVRDQRTLSVNLRVRYSTDYPDSLPELWVEEPQGLMPNLVKELEEELKKLAKEREGEVMMFELAQHVMSFLHKHDRPLVSLHQEMVMRQKETETIRKKQLEAEEQEWRMKEVEAIEEEMKRKKAELRDRKKLRLNSDEEEESDNSSGDDSSSSITQAAPITHSVSLHNQSSLLPTITEDSFAAKTRKEQKLEKSKKIKFKKGKCLGDSVSRGYSVHVGMDLEDGGLLAVYKWTLQAAKSSYAKRSKQVISIQQEFESIIKQGVHHPGLLQHLDMTHSFLRSEAADAKIFVELVMEYVGGGNLNSLFRNAEFGPFPCSMLAIYSKQLLEALAHLHSKGIVHNDIRPSTIFFEKIGSIKLGGSNVIKRLSDLDRATNVYAKQVSLITPTAEDKADMGAWPIGSADLRGGKKGDVFKLGMVLLCMATGKLEINYPPSIPEDLPASLRDFLAKCVDVNEHRRLPAQELLHHSFVLPSPSSASRPLTPYTTHPRHTILEQPGRSLKKESMHFKCSDSIFGCSPVKPSFVGRSRLETEFEELEFIGSGGFGEVIKVRHHLDARIYALKKIQTGSDNKMMNRITREVELLSQMNHENVVRYYNAWLETYTEEEYKKHTNSGTFLDDENDLESAESESENEQLEDLDLEFQNESFSDDSSEFELGSVESDLFHSAEEDVTVGGDDDSFVIFESTSSVRVLKDLSFKTTTTSSLLDEDEEESIFMHDFSDTSKDGEGRNVLGRLESQVMNLSTSKFRNSTTESSDAVVFKDSSVSVAASKPVAIEKGRQRDRRKTKSSGQIQFLYIQMEYCENKTLRQLIDSGDLYSSDDKVWRLLREIAEGLEHIHSKGMIHRDLKPGNVFLNSSGHIKIGDFGLATSYKHSVHKCSFLVDPSVTLNEVGELAGESELVGTTMYMAPELFKNLKYTQKVDTYSLGIIFFEMCHPSTSTAMERHKMLVEIRRPEINLSPFFDTEKSPNKAQIIKLLLDHNPHERPSSKELLQNPLLPLKMEDEELQEVLLRTLQSTNSTSYRHLMIELFAHDGFRVSEFSYFMDPQENKRRSHYLTKSKFNYHTNLLQQLVHSRLVSIFTHHRASFFSPPLLSLRGQSSSSDSAAQLMDTSGTIVVLPHDHRTSFARYVCHQDISYLKRYCISPVFRESRVLGSHPREHYECQFDIVSPSPSCLVPDAEVMYVVSEIINEVPGLQESQFNVLISHTSLLSSILTHCSIPEDKHCDAKTVLHKMTNGSLKSADLMKRLAEDCDIQLSPLAFKSLLRLVQGMVCVESRDEVQLLLEPLLRDKSEGIASLSSQAWQEITSVTSLFRQFGAKQQVYLHPGLTQSSQHFSGVIFQFVDASSSTCLRKNRCSKMLPLAIGGRYDKLLWSYRRPGQSTGHPRASVVGVTVRSDVLMTYALNAYTRDSYLVSKCSVLVCWLGHESLQKECLGMVRDLWAQGISADLLYDSMEKDNMEDIQQFCRYYKISHLVLLGDKTLFFERQQVKLRIFESNKVLEKQVPFTELVEFLQQKHHLTVERSDSLEAKEPVRVGGSHISEAQSTATVPSINITLVITTRVYGHLKRRYHDQAIHKLLPLFQSFSVKQLLEVVVVELKTDILCSLAAELNKMMGGNELDYSTIVKAVCERHSDANKKYISRICDSIDELLTGKKKIGFKPPGPPVIFLYSHSAEFCQIVVNSLVLSS